MLCPQKNKESTKGRQYDESLACIIIITQTDRRFFSCFCFVNKSPALKCLNQSICHFFLKVFFISLHTGFIKHSSLNRMVQLSQNLWGTDYNQPVCYLGIQRTLHPFSARHTCSEFKTSPKLVRGIISVFFQLSNGIIERRHPVT